MTYNPNLGRWLQVDPIAFDAGDMNLYRMEGNNPTTRTDPLGLEPPDPGFVEACRNLFGQDYQGVNEFPVSGDIFYENFIKLKYGNCWDVYKLGCFGLAKCRLGILENSPLYPGHFKGGTPFNLFKPDIIKKYKVKCFKDYQSARNYYNSIKDKETAMIVAAQFNEFLNVKPKPGLGPNEIDPNTVPTTGNGNYATLQYGPKCGRWYWEYMHSGAATGNFTVEHKPLEEGLPGGFKHTVYCVYTIPPK